MLKKCYKCKKEMDVSEFYKDSSRSDGLESRCKECKKTYDSAKGKSQWADPIKRKELQKRNANQFQKHKKERVDHHLEYKKTRREIDPVFLKKERLLARFNYFIKRSHGTRNGIKLTFMGYTKATALKHLSETLKEGYTIQDFMDGVLEIDHIIPQSVFTKMDYIEERKCYDLRNLRLIPYVANATKNNTIDMDLIIEYGIKDLFPKEYIC